MGSSGKKGNECQVPCLCPTWINFMEGAGGSWAATLVGAAINTWHRVFLERIPIFTLLPAQLQAHWELEDLQGRVGYTQ